MLCFFHQCLAEFLSDIFSSFFVFHLHDIIIVTCSPNSDKQFIFDNSPQKWIQFILIAILSFEWLRSWECDIYVYSKTILWFCACLSSTIHKFDDKITAFSVNLRVIFGEHQIYYMFDIRTENLATICWFMQLRHFWIFAYVETYTHNAQHTTQT